MSWRIKQEFSEVTTLLWRSDFSRNFHFPRRSPQQGQEFCKANMRSAWKSLNSAVGLCKTFHPVVAFKKAWYLESRCIFSFSMSVWAEQRREVNRSLPRITHTHKPTIWPWCYHSITTCWWKTRPPTHIRALRLTRKKNTYACTGRALCLCPFFSSKLVIHLILATHTHAALCATTAGTHARTMQRSLANGYGLSVSSYRIHFL